jgi:hypothetical protein
VRVNRTYEAFGSLNVSNSALYPDPAIATEMYCVPFNK